jgi:hypothetical protein
MKILDSFVTWLAYAYIRFGIMRWWSGVHAWLWERNKQEPLARYAGLGELVSKIRTLKWTADTWRELWDSVSSIGHIQWRADHDPKGMIGDCDEFGRYSACVIRNELKNNPKWGTGDIDTTYLLTVMWKKTGGAEWESNRKGYGGHNVCLIKYTDGYWSYMDYGMPSSPQLSVAEVVKQVRDRYAQEYQPLGFAYADPDTLKLVDISME